MTRQTRYSPEVRARAVRMVFEHRGEHASEWAAISSIAAKIGCTAETLRGWVRQAERDQGQRAGPTSEERERIKSLEREVRELRQANEILRKASAYFAMAELDRRSKPSTAAPSIRFRQEAGAAGHRQGSRSSRSTATSTGSSRSAGCCRSPRRRTTSTSTGGAIPRSCRPEPSGTPSCATRSNGSGRRTSASTACGKSGGSCVARRSRSPAAPSPG